MNLRKTFTLRVEEEKLAKLHIIADKNRRSVNNQIEVLIDELICNYEKENGKISCPEN